VNKFLTAANQEAENIIKASSKKKFDIRNKDDRHGIAIQVKNYMKKSTSKNNDSELDTKWPTFPQMQIQ
jgi:hypothetical protein